MKNNKNIEVSIHRSGVANIFYTKTVRVIEVRHDF
jgi:hypothetical protein